MKLLCWVDADMNKRIQEEYKDTNICFVANFEDFCKNMDNDSQIIISSSNFNDFDTSGFVYKVADFIRTLPNQLFHIFSYDEDLGSALSIGVLCREKNVINHQIFPGYKYTIQYHIDVWTPEYIELNRNRESGII
ncbi:MAG: hypothetical protein LBU51_00475 [Bacteroidales bacterium]|jgi:hypothetical protein|nr:hypothetical protein [Bacteroidales bacterium]